MEIKLGQIIDGEATRDAVHVAVAPVIAAEDLRAGQSVGTRSKWNADVVAMVPGIGVVDPFLTSPVKAGQRFWMFLYPGTVTGLRHDWTHPEFPTDDELAYDDGCRGC